MRTVLETIQVGSAYFEKQGVEAPRLSMEHLLAKVLGMRRMDLYLNFERLLTEEELAPLRDLTRRRARGEPLQHLLGNVPFVNLEFKTDARALIPRPETEELVVRLMEEGKSNPPSKVLDMGCGTGCIGLSLAEEWKAHGTQVTLVDFSPKALSLAQENAEQLDLLDRVRFVESDLFQNVPLETYDVLVANLPYIPSGEIPGLSREVQHDPIMALDGGPDGLRLVERFLEEARPYAREGTRVALELADGQHERVLEMGAALGWKDGEALRDLCGIWRFVLLVG